MYLLKICRCCDSIIGELETDNSKTQGIDSSLEVVGNVAYTLCPLCMQELDINPRVYYQ
ncbi:MAG: hypothetical protein GX248_07920 [Peptococcaceae bacterium]|jgi:hypothetical protein|nr:hypothetical protein [Peptococcaceae bacterium]